MAKPAVAAAGINPRFLRPIREEQAGIKSACFLIVFPAF